jgi:hypothetical protein
MIPTYLQLEHIETLLCLPPDEIDDGAHALIRSILEVIAPSPCLA